MAENTSKSWTYVSDEGITFSTRVKDYITGQQDAGLVAKIGGVAAAPDDPPLPKSLRPRAVMVYSVAEKASRRVRIMTTSADLWVNGGTIQLLHNYPPILTTFTVYGREGERDRHWAPSA